MQKTISILISFLLLISTTQLTFGQHYCEGKVVEAAMMVGQEKMSCEPSPTDLGCEDEATETADCCTNVYHQVETDTDYSGSHFTLDFNPEFVVSQVFNLSFHPVVINYSKTATYSKYLPPPLQRDFPVLYQTFLI